MSEYREGKLKGNAYPGDEYYYGECQVCGFKMRMKELTLVENKYDRQKGLLVCKKDLDGVHIDDLPRKFPKEKDLRNPRKVSVPNDTTRRANTLEEMWLHK